MAPVSLVVIGAGQRGTGYAKWARRHPDRTSVVGVAEPHEVRRARFAPEHGIAR
jgi:predicted dehydrogenase